MALEGLRASRVVAEDGEGVTADSVAGCGNIEIEIVRVLLVEEE